MPYRHRRSFWLVLVGTTAFLTIDPALFLVVVALALSGVALIWTVMLTRMLLVEALAAEPTEDAAEGVCPLRVWQRRNGDLSSSARPTPSDHGAFS